MDPYGHSNSSHVNGETTAHYYSNHDRFQELADKVAPDLDELGGMTKPGLLQLQHMRSAGSKDAAHNRIASDSDTSSHLISSNAVRSVGGAHRGGVNLPNGLQKEDPESSSWIHRDKLARIEIEEMQQAGIRIRSDSRPATKRTELGYDAVDVDVNGIPAHDEYSLEPLVQPVSQAESDEIQEELPMNFDLRRPEEVAADLYEEKSQPMQSRRPNRKSSYSKIPLPKSSPIPIPLDYIERHTPSQRNGSLRGSIDEDRIAYRKVRGRSHSVGSQILLDEADHGGRSTPTPGPKHTNPESPPRTKNTSKPGTGSGGPRTSGSQREGSGQFRHHTRSTHSRDFSGPRPGTRSGDGPPGPIRRPEGDPPWLATMYKPDPRLPPEQQLIPTVAKRLQQEQWEREGKSGSVYDRDFNPVSIYEDEVAQTKPAPEPVIEQQPKNEGVAASDWPLKGSKSPVTSNGRPGTSGTEHGGYKVMPNVPTSPTSPQVAVPPVVQPLRVEDPPRENKKEAGCGCCIVM